MLNQSFASSMDLFLRNVEERTSIPVDTLSQMWNIIPNQPLVMKKCRMCRRVLELEANFQKNTCGKQKHDRTGEFYRRNECKKCQRNELQKKQKSKKMAEKWGIDTGTRKGVCDICKETRLLVFDHDHETLVFRGRLCDPCNRSLGIFGDSPKTILGAFNYLNRYRKYVVKQHPVDKTVSIHTHF